MLNNDKKTELAKKIKDIFVDEDNIDIIFDFLMDCKQYDTDSLYSIKEDWSMLEHFAEITIDSLTEKELNMLIKKQKIIF